MPGKRAKTEKSQTALLPPPVQAVGKRRRPGKGEASLQPGPRGLPGIAEKHTHVPQNRFLFFLLYLVKKKKMWPCRERLVKCRSILAKATTQWWRDKSTLVSQQRWYNQRRGRWWLSFPIWKGMRLQYRLKMLSFFFFTFFFFFFFFLLSASLGCISLPSLKVYH